MQLFSFGLGGKRLNSFDDYRTLLLHSVGDHDHATINKIGMHTTANEDDMVAVAFNKQSFGFMPGPEFCGYVYRGHNQVYPTCKPNLYRGSFNYSDELFWQLKVLELIDCIKQHPGVQEVSHWKVDQMRFNLDYFGIAQHYGFKTSYLDLTRSKKIAMFFATHNFQNNHWKPAIGNTAQLLKVNLPLLIDKGIKPLGIYPFLRPFMQKGFLLNLKQNEDLLLFPETEIETFKVTNEITKNARLEVGSPEKIYPVEPMDEYLKKLAKIKEVSINTIRLAKQVGWLPADLPTHFYVDTLNKANYKINQSTPKLPTKNLIRRASKHWLEARQLYFSKMKFRGCADSLVLD